MYRYIIAFVLAVIFNYLINVICFSRTFGILKIDRSDPNKDIYRIFINDDLEKLSRKKRIVLKIDNHADLSQK